MRFEQLKHNKFVQSLLLAMVAGIVFKITTASKYTDDSEYLEQFWRNYQVYAVPFPDDMYFAGEKVPMHDFEVRERVDREILVNTYFQSASILHFKKAARWFPIIEPILKEQGIPDDFKYLAIIESGLANAISSQGAVGYWQIMKNTGLELGMQIDDEVDERYDPIKSTYAACKYFKRAYKEFGSWTMVAASYNMGMSGLRRQATQQGLDDYHGLYLNNETSRYVPRLLAVKEIMENPKKYGYHFRAGHLYKPLRTNEVVVDSAITDLVAFAKKYDITYKHLKVFNPWIRKTFLPAPKSGKPYRIAIPDVSVFDENQQLKPEFKSLMHEVETIEQKAIEPSFMQVKHVVDKGQTLRDIANMFEVRVVDLVIWNELESTQVVKGQTIIVHVQKPVEAEAVQNK
jgi:membrane-bound lytic murein transglycosylase D